MEGRWALQRPNVYRKLPTLCLFMMITGGCVEISLENAGFYSKSPKPVIDLNNKSDSIELVDLYKQKLRRNKDLVLDHVDYLSSELSRVNQMLAYISTDISYILNQLNKCINLRNKYTLELCRLSSIFRHLCILLVGIYNDSEALIKRRYNTTKQ